MSNPKKYPGETDLAYPEIFTTIPKQDSNYKNEYSFSDQQLKQFCEKGYVVVTVFTADELQPVIDSINELIDELAEKLYKSGKIKSLYKECGFNDRLIKLEKDFPGACVLAHKAESIAVPKSFCDIWAHKKLLAKVRQVLGSSVEIAGHPVWNLRTKVPNVDEVTVPWHQDAAYLDNDSYDVMQVTAWIPLLDVKKEHGCMEMAGYGHSSGKVFRHTCCWRDTWYIMLNEEDMVKDYESRGMKMEDVLECVEMKLGDVLFFSNLIPHRSLDNTSDVVRWSLDLRWQDANKPTGFYGLKGAVKMTSLDHPDDFKIDWDSFNNVNRFTKADEFCNKERDDDFDTTVPGPWMSKWEWVHTNRHTDAYKKKMQQSNEERTNWQVDSMLVG